MMTGSSPTSVTTAWKPSSMTSNTFSNEKEKDFSMEYCRNVVFEIGSLSGSLCSLAYQRLPPDTSVTDKTSADNTAADDDEFALSVPNELDTDLGICLARMFLKLYQLSQILSWNILLAVHSKMALNEKKYPADLCKGKAGKYTTYSNVTGITKTTGQSIIDTTVSQEPTNNTLQDILVQLDPLSLKIRDFAQEREWARFHTPRNLILAFMGELGELSELLQWRGDQGSFDGKGDDKYDKLGQELADVTIYLLRLADVCHVNLTARVQDELQRQEETK